MMLPRLNPVLPFEDPSSLEFLSEKNDASLLLLASHSKKRPHNLVMVRGGPEGSVHAGAHGRCACVRRADSSTTRCWT